MGLKENIQAVQSELSTEEQFLEGMIKGERFFQRNKKLILSGVVLVVLGIVAYGANDLLKKQQLNASNEAYQKLHVDPQNSQALATLKEKNPKLYTLFMFENALAKNDSEALKAVASSKDDPILADMARYQLSQSDANQTVNSELLANMVLLQDGYRLFQSNKIDEAKVKLSQIDATSPLKQIAKNLEHYQGVKQ